MTKSFITERELKELHRRLELANVPINLRRLDANIKVVEAITPYGLQYLKPAGNYFYEFPDIIRC